MKAYTLLLQAKTSWSWVRNDEELIQNQWKKRTELSSWLLKAFPDVAFSESLTLGPISKSFQQHGDGCELDKADEVGCVAFPANQQAPLPLEPGKEPLDEPAALVPPQAAAILRLEFPGGSMRRNHVDPVLLEGVIEPITIVGAIANEMLGLDLQHVEVETELHQRDLMMIGRVRPHREWQPMTIHNREDFHAFATAGFSDSVASAFGRGKRCIDEALAFVDRAFVAQRIGQLREDLAQHLPFASLLKSAMHRFAVGIARGQHVPLHPRV